MSENTPQSPFDPNTPSMTLGQDGILDVAIWIDPLMLKREAAFLRHLVVALKADGHIVRFISPSQVDLEQIPTLGSTVESYNWTKLEPLFPPLKNLRLKGLIDHLKEQPPDVLLLWGSSEPLAPTQVLASIPIPTLLWCWDASELFSPLMKLPQIRHVLVSAQNLHERISKDHKVPITVVRPGVFAAESIACYDVPGQVPCLVSLDPLAEMSAFESLMKACRLLTDDGLEFMLFAYDRGAHEHPIWQLAKKMDLLDRIGFVPFQVDTEPLLLHGDLYLHVLPSNRVQYGTLEAMARGLTVVTRPNHAADFLIDGQTCRMIKEPTPDCWREVLQELILDRAKAAGIARRAQQYVQEKHQMSDTVIQFVSLCHHAAGTPIKLNA